MAPKLIGLTGRMDISQFNRDTQSFMKSINDMNKEVAKVAKESAAGARSAGESAGFLGINWQRVKDIVSGVTIISVFRAISREIKSLASEAVKAASDFQKLQIRLEAILARDFAKEFGIPVAQALGQVSGQAKDLLGWIRKVAVTTPFSIETLGNAIAYGQAFGFNVEQSKRLTLATGEFAAGMGLTNEHMTRIIYNFGQMLASGRVLGRELRDLANNFVPIREITQKLADEAGIPFEQMKKAMSEGLVSAEQFIAAFTTMSEEDFAGAMKRMSRTWEGVRQNIQDFVHSVLGLEVLGPVIGRLSGLMADALDRAFADEVLKSFVAVGYTLLSVFNQVFAEAQILFAAIGDLLRALGLGVPTAFSFARAMLTVSTVIAGVISFFTNAVRAITNFVNNVSGIFGKTFTQIIQDAFAWGFNIVATLAEGMAKAVTYIVQVLTAIAQMFTHWLKGGSPPKLLPDLTKWGQQAMQAYLDGWTSADFGIFNDISGIISSFIRSLNIKDIKVIPRILGSRKAIQAAVDEFVKFGEVSERTLNRIYKALKATSKPMKDFIRETFEFAAVSRIVDQAKKVLDFDISLNVPTEIFGAMIKNLQDLTIIAGKFKGELGDALRSYVVALGDVKEANERVANAQKRLNDLTEFYDDQLRKLRSLQTSLRKQKTQEGRLADIEAALASGLLTEEERRRLELERQEILLQERIAAVEDERDAAVDAAQDKLDMEKELADAAEARLEHQRALAEEISKQQLEAAQEQLDVARAAVEMQIETNNLLKEQAKLLEQLAKAAAAGKEGEPLGIPGLDFEGFIDEFTSSLEESKGAIAQAITDLQTDITTRFNAFITSITAPFAGIGEKFTLLFQSISKAFEAAKQDPNIQGFMESVTKFVGSVSEAFGNLRIFWEENGDEILAIIGGFFTKLLGAISPKLGSILEGAGTGLEKFGEFLVLLSEQLIENGPEIQESLQSWVDWVFEVGLPKLKEVWTYIQTTVIPAITDLAGILIRNAPLILGILAALFIGFKAFMGILFLLANLDVFVAIYGLITGLSSLIGGFIASIGGLGGIATAVGSALSTIAPWLVIIAGVVMAVIENFDTLKKVFTAVVAGIGKAMAPAFESLKKAFAELQPSLQKLWKSLQPIFAFLLGALKVIGTVILAVVVPLLVLAIGIIVGIFRALAEGIAALISGFAKIFAGLAKIFNGFVSFFTGIWNFFKGIFTGDAALIEKGFQQVIDGVVGIFTGLWDTIIGILSGAIGIVWSLLGGFVMGIIDFFVGLYDSLVGNSIIPDMLADIVEAFLTFFSETVAGFITWVSDIIAAITGKFGEVLTAGIEFIRNLIEGIRQKVFGEDGLIARVGSYMKKVLEKIAEFFSKFIEKGKELINNLLTGIKEKFEEAAGVYESIKTFIQNTIDKIGELYDKFVQAGKDIIAGIIEGLVAKANALYAQVKAIINKALGKAEEESGSDSPSKVMRDLGVNWMIGFEQGLIQQAGNVENTVANIFGTLAGMPNGMNLTEADLSISSIVDKMKALGDAGSLGTLGAKVDVRHLTQASPGASALLSQPSPMFTNERTINVEINPTYATVQSEASIYYDVRAALAHMSR